MKHEDKATRWSAAHSLRKIGTPEALKAAKEYQKQRSETSETEDVVQVLFRKIDDLLDKRIQERRKET